MAKVKFGDVTVWAPKATAAKLNQGVRASTEALERAVKRLTRPGIRLHRKKGVPLYSADPDDPGILIRELDGKVERGVFKDGGFKAFD
jgi:hypothetical protein